jgi:nitrite reductase/ring-hydroxylating ferredoxin subunit
MGELVKVANLSDVPLGIGRQVSAGGRAVALFNVNGAIYAIDGTCTHRGGPLGEGQLQDGVVTCPWHGARFEASTGKVLGPPAPQGVAVYKVVVEEDAIKVEFP